MPASEARVLANRSNSLRSTGPKSPEGKEASRANSYKHGLTGAGVVASPAESAEVERRVAEFSADLNPQSAIDRVLIRDAARLSVRLDRCAAHEEAMVAEQVRRAEADFVPPEGSTEANAARLRSEAGKRALFDPSTEAHRARQYEAAARRGFHKAVKELRMAEAPEEGGMEQAFEQAMASFSRPEMTDEEFEVYYAETMAAVEARDAARPPEFRAASFGGEVDVPFSIGKRR